MTRGKTIRTDRARAKFLAALAETCNVTHSARVAGISRSAAYEWRDDDETFAAEWTDAEEQAADALELAARERALDGSDRMMEILLKAHRPDKFVERRENKLTFNPLPSSVDDFL